MKSFKHHFSSLYQYFVTTFDKIETFFKLPFRLITEKYLRKNNTLFTLRSERLIQ